MTTARQIDIEVLADPESCQRTAAQLARLGQACVQVAGRLGRRAQVSEDDLGGLSGTVYRQSVARAGATCDRLATDCARLADGLADYARDVADVRRLMEQARATAAPWLTTCAWAIWSPGQPPDPADAALSRRWEAWHESVGWWRRARDLEDLAEQRWLHVLGRATAPDEPGAAGPALTGPHHHHHPEGGHQPPAPDTDPPVGPVDDGEPVGPVLVTVAGDGPRPPHPDRETGAERVPEPHADHKTGEAMAEPVPVNLPESSAVGAGLGSAGLLGGAGGRDPLTHPEPTDPGPRDGHGAVR